MNLKLPVEDVCEIIENPNSHQRRLLVERIVSLSPGISSSRSKRILEELELGDFPYIGDLKVRQRIKLGEVLRSYSGEESSLEARPMSQ